MQLFAASAFDEKVHYVSMTIAPRKKVACFDIATSARQYGQGVKNVSGLGQNSQKSEIWIGFRWCDEKVLNCTNL